MRQLTMDLIRDSAVIAGIEVGVKAIGTTPRKSIKRGEGQQDIAVTFAGVTFAGVTFEPGAYRLGRCRLVALVCRP